MRTLDCRLPMALRQTKYNKPLHRIAARVQKLLNLKGHDGAANGDWDRWAFGG